MEVPYFDTCINTTTSGCTPEREPGAPAHRAGSNSRKSALCGFRV
jgi:hypothetical protein